MLSPLQQRAHRLIEKADKALDDAIIALDAIEHSVTASSMEEIEYKKYKARLQGALLTMMTVQSELNVLDFAAKKIDEAFGRLEKETAKTAEVAFKEMEKIHDVDRIPPA